MAEARWWRRSGDGGGAVSGGGGGGGRLLTEDFVAPARMLCKRARKRERAQVKPNFCKKINFLKGN